MRHEKTKWLQLKHLVQSLMSTSEEVIREVETCVWVWRRIRRRIFWYENHVKSLKILIRAFTFFSHFITHHINLHLSCWEIVNELQVKTWFLSINQQVCVRCEYAAPSRESRLIYCCWLKVKLREKKFLKNLCGKEQTLIMKVIYASAIFEWTKLIKIGSILNYLNFVTLRAFWIR